MELTVSPINSCDLVVITGRIDSFTSPELSAKLTQLIENNRYKIILDLGGVIFISSAGLRILIELQKKCKKDNQGEVLLVNTPARVCETLELTGFLTFFNLYTDVSSAVEAF